MPKPPLSVVPLETTSSSPPRKLGPHGTALWNQVMAEYAITDRCAALDRAESLAEAIALDGPVIHGRGGPRSHPGCKDELACRAFVVRTLERLGLNVEVIKPMGRPTRPLGWTGETL